MVTKTEYIPAGSIVKLTLKEGEREVSRVTYILVHNKKGPHVLIEDVWTDPSERGKGYASLLIKEAIRKACNDGAYKITLTCSPSLVSFYEKYGFRARSVCTGSTSVSMRADCADICTERICDTLCKNN